MNSEHLHLSRPKVLGACEKRQGIYWCMAQWERIDIDVGGALCVAIGAGPHVNIRRSERWTVTVDIKNGIACFSRPHCQFDRAHTVRAM